MLLRWWHYTILLLFVGVPFLFLAMFLCGWCVCNKMTKVVPANRPCKHLKSLFLGISIILSMVLLAPIQVIHHYRKEEHKLQPQPVVVIPVIPQVSSQPIPQYIPVQPPPQFQYHQPQCPPPQVYVHHPPPVVYNQYNPPQPLR